MSTLHENVPIIETATKHQLDVLYADPALAVYLLTRLSDTVAVIQPDKFDVLLARLRKGGHLPQVMENK